MPEVEVAATELVAVMDSYGGDWTPFVVMRDADEALRLQEMLEADADAKCSPVPYYADKQAVKDEDPSSPPEDVDELSIAFNNDEAVAVSDDDLVAREAQFEKGGLRGTTPVYETAEAVVEDRPSAVGKFIASELSAEDLLEAIQ